MPNYSQYVESIGTGGSQIDIKYDITDTEVQVDYPVGTYDAQSNQYTNTGTATGIMRGYTAPNDWQDVFSGVSGFRQCTKIPDAVTIDPCDSTGQSWYVSGYSAKADRIVYVGEDLTEKLDNNYTGCCFDENGNQVSEPSLNQARTMDIVLEGLQFDAHGKFTYASMPNDFYKFNCTTIPLATITRSETFSVTFESMSPNIAASAPYLDDDVTVTLERSDGTSVTATSSSGTVTLSATAPQTITIKIGGEFGKKLFPEETWEYYYEKNSEFTANSDHENFEISYDARKPNPNEFFEPYRIDKDNNSGSADLSTEVPTGVSLLSYTGDIQERAAGSNVDSEGSTIRSGHKDVVFRFSVTSSIPGISTTPWSDTTPLSTGSYCTNGGNTYLVEAGGTPDDENDTGPSGTGLFADSSGMRYRYIPDEALVTTFGAGTEYDMILYVMNDYLIGQSRFEQLINEADARRVK